MLQVLQQQALGATHIVIHVHVGVAQVALGGGVAALQRARAEALRLLRRDPARWCGALVLVSENSPHTRT